MPVIATVEPGKVTGIWGQASLRLPDGSSRPLRIGDVVHKGDLIITTQNGIVEIQNDQGVIVAADGQLIPETRPAAKAAAEESIDRVIQAVEAGDPEAATAAGAANSGGEAESALRVGRVSEGVGAGSLVASASSDGSEQVPEFATPRLDDTEAETTVPTANAAPTAGNASAATGENTTLESRVPPATDTDGAITGYQLIAGPVAGSGNLTFNPDGSYRFDPGTDFDSLPAGETRTISFSYIAIDNDGAASAPATITITVTGTNDAPVAQAASFSVAEDAPILNGSVTATDPDSNSVLTFALDGAAPAGLVFNANGTYSFDPSDAVYQSLGVGQSQVITVPYTVTDDQGATSTADLVITVTGTNDAPVAVADIASTPINTTIANINVLGNDTDAEGDTLTVTAAALANPAQGTVSINSDGTLSFTPALNVTGPVVVNYTVSDPAGATSSASVTVNVGANTAPAGADATLTMLEDGSRSFSAADFGFSDADAGQTLANVRIDSLPLAGSLTYNGAATFVGQVIAAADLGNLRFVPAPDANGANYASFTFSVQDSAGGFDPTPNTITIDVTPVADPAVIGGQAGGATVEDVTLVATGLLTVTDPDAGEAAFVPVSGLAGAHGSFSIDAAGAWTYSLDNADPAVQALGAGQSLPSETFTVSTIDGTTQVVTISITGTDDAPVISAGSGSVVEDTQPSISGTLTATDVDNPGLAFSAGTVSGAYGSLVLAANGAWTYTLDARAEALAAGQVASDPITVTLNDGSTTTVTLSITGTNDAAVITGTSIGSVTEDGVVSAGGTLAATDIDDPATFVAATSAGTYGDFTITTAGAWSYVLRNTDANVQALTSADQPIESFTVTTADGTTQTIAVTVNGANEAPIAVISPASGLEDSVGIPITLGATDVDGSIASFTLTTLPANGVLLFGGAPVLAGVPIPATAGSATLSFVPAADWNGSTSLVFTAVDNEGASSPAVTQTIMVQAVNDAPVASAVSASGLEDQAARILITLAATDVDGSIASYRITTLPANGSLFATATGGSALSVGAIVSGPVYFVPSANANGSTSFQYTATDNSGAVSPAATATIVVAPVNDRPTLTGLGPTLNYVESNAATVTRTIIDGAVVLGDIDSPNFGGGSLTVAITNSNAVRANQDLLDVNNQGNGAGQIGVSGSNVSFGGVLIGTLSGGTGGAPLVVSLNSNATVTAVDALIQNIRYGNQAQLPDTTARTVSFTMVDGDGTANGGTDTRVVTTTINVASRNDAPTFAALGGTVAYTENGPAAVLDSNATLTDPELGLGAIGGLNNMGGATLTLVRNGGANAQDQFVGTGALVLNAGNVVLGGANVGTYNAAQLATGQLAITFASGTTNAQASSVLQQIGYQNSSDTPPASVRINFTVNDGNTGAQGTGGARSSAISFVTVNITPFNDAPIANPDTTTAVEAGGVANGTAGINPTGTVLGNDSDPEGAALAVSAVSGVAAGVVGGSTAGQYGSLVLLANGTYTYTLNNGLAAVQALSPGQTLTDTFNYTARDPGAATASSTLTITIQGANDAAVITPAVVNLTETNAVLTTGGTLAITDIDSPATFVAQSNAGGSNGYGSFTLGTNGVWSYTTTTAHDEFVAGTTYTDSLTVTSADGTTSTITVNIVGTDDAPVISVGSGSVVEDTQPSISGTLTATDVDNPALAFTAGTVSGTYGSLVLAASGVWTYTLDARAEALTGGEFASDPIPVTLSDGSTTIVTIGITGTNDGATISGTSTAAVTEDVSVTAGNLTAAGSLSVADVDSGQAVFATPATLAGTYGAFTFNTTTGAWTYAASNAQSAIQQLGAGQSLTDSITVTSLDGSASQIIRVTINGTNDAPVASAASFTVAEDATIVSGSVVATDADTGAVLSFALVNPAPAGLVFNANGSYSFNPANAAYQSLGVGQSQVITVPYAVTDDQGATSTANLVITVTGADDAPVISVGSGSVVENTQPSISGTLTATDVDNPALAFAAGTVSGAYGSLVLAADGAWTYTLDARAEALASGEVVSDPITVTLSDGSTTTVTIGITGINDGAVITPALVNLTETNAVLTTGGTLAITDVDSPALFVAQSNVAGSNGYGSFTLATNGAWTYTANTAHNEFVAGVTYSDQLIVTSADGTTSVITVNILGTNDAPVVSDGAAGAGENAVLSSSVPAATDVDSTIASYALVTGPGTGNGSLVFNSNGTYSFNPGADFDALAAGATRQVSFTYTATDDSSAVSAPATVTITVTGTNDAPVATPDTATTFEDVALTIPRATLLANDTDIDGGALTITSVQGATNGTVALVGSNVVFTPNANYNGPASFTYTVSDGQGGTATGTVALTVTPVNDATAPTLRISPIGRWTFDENTGTTTTNAYTAQTGTLNDTVTTPSAVLPTWVSGRGGTAGTALNFDGTGSRVALDATATQPLMGTATLSFWIRTTQTGSSNSSGWNSPAVIASEQSGGGNDIQWGAINTQGQIGFGIGNTAGVYSSTAINDNTWHQVAITRNAANNAVNVYVDGVLSASGNPTDAAFNAALNRLAGLGQTNNFSGSGAGADLADNRFLNGQLDDIRIYDRVLTADQILAIQRVESGFHDTALANDGGALRLSLAAASATSLTVTGLEAGMVITDGTNSATVTSTDDVVNLSTWNVANLSVTGAGSATLAFNSSNTVSGETVAAPTQYINIVTGTTLLAGASGNDTLPGTANADLLSGGAGIDTLNGNAGNDRLIGGGGNDTLNGGNGRDVLFGGSGDDNLTGGAGVDVFAWKLADRGTAGSPATDTIADFNSDLPTNAAQGDVLDLRDLLQGSNYVGANAGNLQNYLDFNVTGGNTEIRISSTGQFSGGVYSASAEDQRIVLEGVDIRASLSLAPAATDNQIVQELLTRGKLLGAGGP